MDELDRKLLFELQNRGLDKISNLARILGVGERTVRRRIANMESKGTIKMVALPNLKLAGYRAWAKIGINVDHKSLNSVTRQLVEHPSIYFVAHSLGAFDIIIAVHLPTIERLAYLVNSELTKIKGILRTETMILVQPRKYYNFSWPAPVYEKASNEWEDYIDTTSSQTQNELDETDRRILTVLEREGVARPAALKSRLGIREATIRTRIKNMLSNGTLRIEAVLNPEASEYEVWATMGINVTNQFAHKALDDIIKNRAVYLASVCLSRFNLVVAAHFRNMDLLNQFVNMELSKIEGVGSVETFLHTRPLKYHNIDWFHGK